MPSDADAGAGFTRLPLRGRIALLTLLGIVLIVDVILYFNGSAVSWQGMALGLAATLATSLFVWWPPVAVVSLLLTALVETASGQSGPQFLYLVIVAGLVVYTCPGWFVGIYGAATAALVAFAASAPGALSSTALPALALVLAVSAGIGWALRAAHGRERRFARDIERLEGARAAAIEAERERIADELHDIIAHDVTLVSMHVRVLERVDDPHLREQSIRAIRSSADQALADIRRMLRIVRDDRVTASVAGEAPASAVSALEDVRTSLERLGASVTVRAPIEDKLSAAVEQTLVHLLREGATNIAKHAPEHPTVSIVVESIHDGVLVEISNSIGGPHRATHVPSSGYGLDRLRERVTLLGGNLHTNVDGGRWTLTARLPAR